MSSQINKIEKKFIKHGLETSRTQRNYILDHSDLTKEQCLAISKSTNIEQYPGLFEFINTFDNNAKMPNRWRIDEVNSQAQIVIPRASRKIHSILLNPYWEKESVYFSSNFVCLWNCRLTISGLSTTQVLEFLAGFLNSSFGQIMFEIECQNREGLRKTEKGVIAKKIFAPNGKLDSFVLEIKEIIDKFHHLEYGLTGVENSSSRDELDSAVSKFLWAIEPLFKKYAKSDEDLSFQTKEYLQDLVRDRHEI